MKKDFILFVFICFIFLHIPVYAGKNNPNFKEYISNVDSDLFVSPPAVSSPIYYCKGSAASPLTATPSAGGTLNWYGTASVGGVSSSTAPTPSTATVGTTSYYVSETVGGVESARSKIDVIVVADNGATILNFRCDPTQIAAADKYSSVFFDWSNNPLISNSYNYTYTIQGGSPVSGNTGVSHYQIFGMSPGQSATLTLSSATHPCVPSQTITCSVPCGPSNVAPNFPAIAPICSGSVPPTLDPTSPNGITGTWSPAVIDNMTSGSYVFTPDPVAFPCATTQTLAVTVGQFKEPDFIDLSICYGSPAPNLDTRSPNGIDGTWSPAIIDNTTDGMYDFTPNPGQCATSKSIEVQVHPLVNILAVDWTVSEAFAENQVISLVVTPAGSYLYQLDDGSFQEKSSFEHVSYGMHSVTVMDLYGCSLPFTINNIHVINYPKFFTPNGDNFNDFWNISEMQADLTAKIHIFDRYGKLLKEIRPNGSGWNGTYNGKPLPADDYWFLVQYTEQNIPKEFRSHFSLKR